MKTMIMNKRDTQALIRNIRNAGYEVIKKVSNLPTVYEVNINDKNIFRAMIGKRGYMITYAEGFITEKARG